MVDCAKAVPIESGVAGGAINASTKAATKVSRACAIQGAACDRSVFYFCSFVPVAPTPSTCVGTAAATMDRGIPVKHAVTATATATAIAIVTATTTTAAPFTTPQVGNVSAVFASSRGNPRMSVHAPPCISTTQIPAVPGTPISPAAMTVDFPPSPATPSIPKPSAFEPATHSCAVAISSPKPPMPRPVVIPKRRLSAKESIPSPVKWGRGILSYGNINCAVFVKPAAIQLATTKPPVRARANALRAVADRVAMRRIPTVSMMVQSLRAAKIVVAARRSLTLFSAITNVFHASRYQRSDISNHWPKALQSDSKSMDDGCFIPAFEILLMNGLPL